MARQDCLVSDHENLPAPSMVMTCKSQTNIGASAKTVAEGYTQALIAKLDIRQISLNLQGFLFFVGGEGLVCSGLRRVAQYKTNRH
jgi:hypothetical protein